MRRIIPWPVGLKFTSREALSGPRSIGAGSNETINGGTQTFASAFGGWVWRFSLPNLAGKSFVAWRGTVAAMNGGANAVVVPWYDPDGLTLAESGVKATAAQEAWGIPWGNGLPWSNGQGWQIGRPSVAVAAPASLKAVDIQLANTTWGWSLQVGHVIGFTPFHFGWYIVTRANGNGSYRIWPPLRKAVSTTDYATLNPSMAMKMASESSAPIGRGRSFAASPTITLMEVQDPDVRAFFTW